MIPGSMEDRIMKKYTFILVAICACLVLSCTKENPKFEEDNSSPAMKTVTITASIDDVLTKTSYADGTTFSWTKGDKISVMCSDGEFRTFTADAAGTASTFTGEVPETVELGTYAFFPADDNHSGSNRNFYLPESKDLSETGSADLPMLGSKATDSDAFSFQHCTGAVLFTLANIPANITTVEISFESASLKLSGTFYIDGPSAQTDLGAGCYWTARGGTTTSDKTFTRKVKVNSDHTAQVYLPYAATASMYAANTVNVKGFDINGNPSVLLENRTMKAISDYTFALAHVKPLTPLVLSNLNHIDWNSISGYTGDGNYAAFKVTSDDYYVYFYSKIKKAAVKWGTTAGDGENGSYIYYGVDTDQDSTTGNDFWGGAGKFNSIALVYPYDLGETIRTAPYVAVNKVRKNVVCFGAIGSGEDAMVETSIAVLRSDLNVSKGTTVNVYSYASSNISQYTSEFEVTL